VGWPVRAVTHRPWSVEVTYRQAGPEHTIEADYGVATLPPHLMARIPANLGTFVPASGRQGSTLGALFY
jgi:monoamine oxidase